MWAKGLNTNSSELVSLTGSTYFADDLTISGRNNNVTLAGNYYGMVLQSLHSLMTASSKTVMWEQVLQS